MAAKNSDLTWIALPDPRLRVSGLPLNAHLSAGAAPSTPLHWHRLPTSAACNLPEAVAQQARYPAGAVVRFHSDTRQLALRVTARSPSRGAGIDIMVDGALWKTVQLAPGEQDIAVFAGMAPQERQYQLYLPGDQELTLEQLGISADASIAATQGDHSALPILFYGSSIVQGAGSRLSCMSYPAVIGRQLGLDTVNFGFYGAGKAEPEVVTEVLKVAAQTLVFDLGKSFGTQGAAVYQRMLEMARDQQPQAKRVCVTPIVSLRECYDSKFADFSHRLRDTMASAAARVRNTVVVDGPSLLSAADWSGFSADGLHPNEWGYSLIAQRLTRQLEN